MKIVARDKRNRYARPEHAACSYRWFEGSGAQPVAARQTLADRTRGCIHGDRANSEISQGLNRRLSGGFDSCQIKC